MTKKITSIAIAAALMTSTAAVPAALAQDSDAGAGAGVEAGADVGVDEGGVELDAGAGADAGAGTAEGSGSAGTSASAGAAADAGAGAGISSITEDDTIKIVKMSEVEGSANAQAEQQVFDEAMSKDANWQSTLESSVEANTALTAALEEEGFAAEDVVDVRADSQSNIVVFVDDTA